MEMLIERRPYMQQLRELRDEHIIKVITGVRRCGKSTLLEMFSGELRKTVTKKQIQFYNFEDPDVFAIGDYKVKLIPEKMNYIFLGLNSQNLPKSESFRNLEGGPQNSPNLSKSELLGNFIYTGSIPQAVVIDKDGYVSYYQVAYLIADPATLERELAPLRAIRDSNPKYLLSADWDINPVYDGIRKRNVAEWLLERN
ncbi:hypothetical protein FACS189450_07710 [Spirochaetia bacterium]|nr:hypothetical protein FACS189450_07710 [Spirochaetia bacterium]